MTERYGFSRDGARRVKAATEAYERQPKSPDNARPWRPPGGGEPQIVKTPGGGIATGATSYADCTKTTTNATTGAITDVPSETVRVFNNPGAGAVGGAKYLIVAFVQGVWRPIVEPC
jgi:hypothetical protein